MNYKSIPTKPRPPRVENGVQIIDDVDLLMDDNYYYFYKDELFTGRSETRYKNGMLRVISEYKEGIPHGVQRSWFRNGQMKKEIFFEKGCARGWNKEWYENGRLHLERFIGDRGYSLQGKEYDDQGQVIRAWDEEGQLIIGEPSQEKPGCADTMMKKVFKELAPYREKLIEAIRKEDIEMVKDIVYRDVHPDYKDKTGKTPLQWAWETGNHTIIDFLLQEGARPDSFGWINWVWHKLFTFFHKNL